MKKHSLLSHFFIFSFLLSGCADEPPAEPAQPPAKLPSLNEGLCPSQYETYETCDWASSADIGVYGTIISAKFVYSPVYLPMGGGNWATVTSEECREIAPGITITLGDIFYLKGVGEPVISFSIGGSVANMFNAGLMEESGDAITGGNVGFFPGQKLGAFLHREGDASYSLLTERMFTFEETGISFAPGPDCVGAMPRDVTQRTPEELEVYLMECSPDPSRAELRASMLDRKSGASANGALCQGPITDNETPPSGCSGPQDCDETSLCDVLTGECIN